MWSPGYSSPASGSSPYSVLPLSKDNSCLGLLPLHQQVQGCQDTCCPPLAVVAVEAVLG